MSKPFDMPHVAVGPCVWYAAADDVQGVPAVITQVGSRSVMLTVFAPDNRGGLPKDGVRHRGDPELRDHPNYEGGCWDYSASELRLRVQEHLIAALQDECLDLRRALDGTRGELVAFRESLEA